MMLWIAMSGAWAGSPADGFPPDVRRGALVVSPASSEGAANFRNEVEGLLAAGDLVGAAARFPDSAQSIRGWLEKVHPSIESPLQVLFDVAYPVGSGVAVTDLQIYTSPYAGGHAKWTSSKPLFLGPDADGVWRVHSYPTASQIPARLVAVAADVTLSPRAEWLDAGVELTLRPEGMTAIPFTLAAREPGGSGGFRVIDVTQDGVPDGIAPDRVHRSRLRVPAEIDLPT
jgi:hypothetical protein